MPGLLNDVLDRPWAIALVVAGAFVLPLLLADLVRGDAAPRQVARVTTVEATGPEGAAAPGIRIPDLRRTAALPRMQGAPAPAAPAAAAPPAAATTEGSP